MAFEDEVFDLINPNDFKSIELVVSLKNDTTGTNLSDGSRGFIDKNSTTDKGEDLSIKFCEFVENGLILDVPERTCAEGHLLTLTIEVKNASEPLIFNTTAKVDIVEPLDDYEKTKGIKRDSISVDLVQYEEAEWVKLQNVFADRQAEILQFFDAAKGR